MARDLAVEFGSFADVCVIVRAYSDAGRRFLAQMAGVAAEYYAPVESIELRKSAAQDVWNRAVDAGLVIDCVAR
jgi:hypothetical protein